MPEPGPVETPDAAKVAIVLASDLPPGPAANVASCIAAGLAASSRGWAGRPLVDASGLASVASSHVPIAILCAEPARMQALMQRLTEERPGEGCTVSLFPAYAQALHDCSAYWDRHAGSVHTGEVMLGVGVRGPKRWVNRLTGSLPLWR